MRDIASEREMLEKIMKGIAEQFGKNCEVCLHDYAQPYDHTIVSIINGEVTGRKVGDCGTNFGLQIMQGTSSEEGQYNYITQIKNGKTIRSTSIYLKNDEGALIGCLCINFDITDLIMAKNVLEGVTYSYDYKTQASESQKENLSGGDSEVITGDVNELLDTLIQKSIQSVGVPVGLMGKDEKIKGIRYLENKGVFLIKKSSERVAQFYDISKYTLYNYLEEIRSGNNNSCTY